MSTKPSPRRVSDLKEKAKREANQPASGNTVHTVLYGAHNDNSTASGVGEYNR